MDCENLLDWPLFITEVSLNGNYLIYQENIIMITLYLKTVTTLQKKLLTFPMTKWIEMFSKVGKFSLETNFRK